MVEKVSSPWADEIFKDYNETGWIVTDNVALNATVALNIEGLCSYSHEIAAARGWWHRKRDPQAHSAGESEYVLREHDVGNRISLMHSELSEAFEGTRKDAMDEHCPQFSSEAVELADLLHRVFDYAKARNLPLGEAYVAKAIYNTKRKDHSLAAREAVGGKQF